MLIHTIWTAAVSTVLAVVNGLAHAGDQWAVGLGCDTRSR